MWTTCTILWIYLVENKVNIVDYLSYTVGISCGAPRYIVGTPKYVLWNTQYTGGIRILTVHTYEYIYYIADTKIKIIEYNNMILQVLISALIDMILTNTIYYNELIIIIIYLVPHLDRGLQT